MTKNLTYYLNDIKVILGSVDDGLRSYSLPFFIPCSHFYLILCNNNNMSANKDYKTVDELMSILSNKGMNFSQPIRAKRLIEENGYYNITGYKHLFYRSGTRCYLPNTDFEHLFAVYTFDKKFKTIILKHLLLVEQKIKSAINRQISPKYGVRVKQYLNPNNFDKSNPYMANVIAKAKGQISKFGKKNKCVQHYKVKYHYVPFWVAAKCLTIGVIRDLFFVMKPDEQNIIANDLLEKKINNKPVRKLKNMIAIIADVRNMCAHDEMLIGYVHKRIDIGEMPEHSQIQCKKESGILIQGRKDILAVLISIKYLVNRTTYNELIQEISSLINKYHKRIKTIVNKERFLEYIGLPIDYENLKNIN